MRERTLGIVGVSGRLGSRIAAAAEAKGLPVTFTANRTTWQVGTPPSVVIDAGSAAALDRVVRFCRDTGAGLVSCVSGLSDETPLRELAEVVPVVRATNLSVGHWIQARLIAHAARLATASASAPHAAVFERHTTAKADRPSASALALAGVWSAAAGGGTPEISSYRAGLPVSEHQLELTFAHETLTIRHDVRDLGAAVEGALAAAEWAHHAAAGLTTIGELFTTHFLGEQP
ncbi:dihydrodipicolinate reductase C-terminal domain-containing protein [Amycolatopsis lurida]